MEERARARLVSALIAFMVLAVGWNLFAKLRTAPADVRQPLDTGAPSPVSEAPTGTRSEAGAEVASSDTGGPGYLDLVARADMRRRIRASAPFTYLNDIVAASNDSMLHRWDGRATNPVRVYLARGTVANFQPAFLDAIRAAFQRWAAAGVPVRFDVTGDSGNAEVRFAWRIQFEIDRTGQTDLEWDQDGHLRSGVVTIATFDPRGQPLAPDDLRVVALHEIGHLIGLDHSPDSTDLMFAKAAVRDLSERDVRTARLLYDLAPGSLR